MAQRVYSAEEAYALLASDTDTASEGEDGEPTFLHSSSSSSSSSEDERPPRRQRRAMTERAPPPPPTPAQSDSVWSPPPEDYEPRIPDFVGQPGIQLFPTGRTEIEFFKLFFSDDLVAMIVAQTNLYAQQFLDSHPGSFLARPQRWTPVTDAELAVFWGLSLHMGLVKKPTLRQYWSADVLYNTPLYRMAMSRTRYEEIHKFQHFADNAACPPREDPAYDRLYKIRPVIEHFANKFMAMYIPEKYIAIDESLVSFKGRLKFRQYLPCKRARYGIKLYKLCESTSGYTYRFRVYEGKDTQITPPECPPRLGVSGKLVWDLLHPLLDKGYHLYVDNFYTSIPLFQCLTGRATVACGTVRKNQRGLPPHPIRSPLPRGERRAFICDNMLLVRYKDKRDVLMLSTGHSDTVTPTPVRGTTTVVQKPDCILDYNRYMGGVDLSDQVLQPYCAMRKSSVWYKKLAVHIVQMAMYNAYVLFRCDGRTGTFLQFQENVIKALVFGSQERAVPGTSGTGGPRIVPGQHFPGEVPSTGKKGRSQKRCRVCHRRGVRKDTIYQCNTCTDNPGLCIKDCFQEYHSSMDY